MRGSRDNDKESKEITDRYYWYNLNDNDVRSRRGNMMMRMKMIYVYHQRKIGGKDF